MKPPIWHCDNGVLKMGKVDDSKQRTVYYSYTNLKTEGTISLVDKDGNIRQLETVGEFWFDKQWVHTT